ncbi:unnamed protein product [Didymodactylos carnosus]|uniref:Uncharacterized protein n=1 Tax=Didymodactylos carnosus TaxID=1234261 RepID=A0A814L4R9_9BILA|nr:unnamed protein product [Didymodactylos carnosus]CAF3827962.1 unnamed protein product [Didymodactylos carnosus]
MSAVIMRWKNRIHKPNHRDSVKHVVPDSSEYDQLKSINLTLEKLHNENVLLKEHFSKLESTVTKTYQQWESDEKAYLLRRIEQLETENYRLKQNYNYQTQCDKCIRAITDLVIKTIIMQEIFGSATFGRNDIWARGIWARRHLDACTTKAFSKSAFVKNERKPKATRSVSCQFTYENQTYTSKETLSPIQPEWLKKRLLIEEDDDETKKLKSFRNHHRVSAFSDKTGHFSQDSGYFDYRRTILRQKTALKLD